MARRSHHAPVVCVIRSRPDSRRRLALRCPAPRPTVTRLGAEEKRSDCVGTLDDASHKRAGRLKSVRASKIRVSRMNPHCA